MNLLWLHIKAINFADECCFLARSIGLDKWVAGFSENIAILVPAKVGVGSNAFLVSTYQRTLLLSSILLYCQILLVWISGWLDFLKIYEFQPPIQAVVGSHALFCE